MEVPYGDLAKKAREQVRDLEEPFKSIAYQTILQDLIQDAKKGTVAPPGQREISFEKGEDPVQLFLTTKVNASPYVGLFAAPGKLTEKGLAVLKLARDELAIDGLTAPQIAEVLVKKFRVARVQRPNVSRDLGRASKYVSRIKTDGEYKYLLMAAGEQHVDELAARFK